jgi:hypothetical protein
MAYAYGPIVSARETGVFSISHYRNVFNHETLISSLGPRQSFQLSIKVSVMLRPNFIPVMKTSVLIYLIRQWQIQPGTRRSKPQQHRPLPQFVPTLGYSQRFQHARTQLAAISSDIRRFCFILSAAAPVKPNEHWSRGVKIAVGLGWTFPTYKRRGKTLKNIILFVFSMLIPMPSSSNQPVSRFYIMYRHISIQDTERRDN